MLPIDLFDEWFTNRVDEVNSWRALLNTPASGIAPSQVYIGVTGAGKTHLRRRFEQVARLANVPYVTIELDPLKEGASVDTAILAHRFVLAMDIEAPRVTMALLRIAAMESADPVVEQRLTRELATAALGAGFDAIISQLQSVSVGGVLAILFKQFYAKVKRDKSVLQRFLNTEEGEHVRKWILIQRDSSTIRTVLFDLLGQDLHAANPRPQYSVKAFLFVDSGEHRNAEEQWLDRLLDAMAQHGPPMLVAAVFSQTDITSRVPQERLVRHTIGGFKRADAIVYCTKKRGVPLTTAENFLSEALEEGLEERYHVYSLGLLCDAALDNRGPLALQEIDRQLTRPDALSRRFLRRLSDAEQGFLRRLALVPTFDEDAACRACAAGEDDERRAATMRWLLSFSFVQSAAASSWRLHAVMRRVLAMTSLPGDNLRRHLEWAEYWSGRSKSPTDDAAARAWYHRFANDPDVTMRQWEHEAGRALQEMRSDDHAWYVATAELFVHSSVIGADVSPESAAAALVKWADAAQQSRLGDLSSLIRRSVAAYRAALEVYTREFSPADWAMTQNNLGSALQTLGQRGDERALRDAVAAYRAALEVYTRESSPADWATTQNNLGNAFLTLGQRGDVQALRDAVAAYRAALEVFIREAAHAYWATTQNNLGNAFLTLGQRGDERALRDAVAAYRAALEVYTREFSPADWAMTQNNLGNAFLALGERGDEQALRDAVAAYRAALEVYTREFSPAEWATTQNNLGNAFLELGQRGDERALGDALAAFRAALEVYTREFSPAYWAMTQNNLGNAFLELGERGDERALRDAVAAFRAALEVYTREFSPAHWAMTQNNLGDALLLKAKRDRDKDAAFQAIEAYDHAEEGYRTTGRIEQANAVEVSRREAREILEDLSRDDA